MYQYIINITLLYSQKLVWMKNCKVTLYKSDMWTDIKYMNLLGIFSSVDRAYTLTLVCRHLQRLSQVALVVRNLPASAGDIRDLGSIPGLGSSPGGGQGNPPQYSCLENPWAEEPGGLLSVESQRVGHDWARVHVRARTHTHTHEETADPDTTPAHSADRMPPPSVLQFVCAVFSVL